MLLAKESVRASREQPPARNSHHMHRSDDDSTSDAFSNKLNNYNTLSLKLHVGFCCCHPMQALRTQETHVLPRHVEYISSRPT